MLRRDCCAPLVLSVFLIACGVVQVALASPVPMGQVSAVPLPGTLAVAELPARVSADDDGAWNAAYTDTRQYEGSDGDVLVAALTANIQVFKIEDGWPDYDWYLINLHTQTEITPGSYQQDFPGVPFTSGTVGWYFQDSQTRIDADVYGDGPLALEDYGPLSSPAGVTDSFTIGGGLALTPEGPSGGIDGSFSRAITHPSVAISDTSSMVSKYGSWSEDFFCPHGNYSWWPIVDWPADESMHSHRMDYAVIAKVVGGQPDRGVHVSVSFRDSAYRDDITNNLVYYTIARSQWDLGEDGIEVNVYRNNPPEVTAFFPNYTPVPAQVGQRLDFSVSWSDPDGTSDSVTWYLDDVEQGSGESWVWTIPSGAGGATGQTHVVTAVIADELDSTTQVWNVQVGPEPWADFSASPTMGQAPLEVAFTDLSANSPNSWAWAFGDGGTSTAQHATHTYADAGIYTVSLTASGGPSSATTTKERYILVTFPDVPCEPDEYWALQQILACVDAGIVKGYDDGLYRPDLEVTRDQMAVYISRALAGGDSSIPDGPATASFSDVPSNHWAYKHIEYAVSQNAVQGYEDGTYLPGVTVDRGTMAVYIARAMVAPGGDAAIPDPVPPATFPDVPDTFWAYKQVEYCAGQGVVKGYDDGNYHPEIVVTRDQMAVYIARAFGLL